MSATTNAVAEALECTRGGCECHATARRGRGATHCPAHSDIYHPSLSVSEKGQKTLWHCLTGCPQEAVTAALRERGLIHAVHDSQGQLRAYHERKGRWVKPDGTVGLNGTKPADMLFGLEKLAGRPEAPVVLVEGEKAADALQAKLGTSTVVLGTFGASSTPAAEVLGHLQGRRVFLWPDNDEPGRRHMAAIGERLTTIGVAELRSVDWPDAPEKGDAADFCSDHDTAATIALIKAAKAWEALTPEEDKQSGVLLFKTARQRAAESPPLVEWVIGGFAAAGVITEVDGSLKLSGKTTLLAHAVRAKLDGRPFLGQDTQNGPVVWLTEESWATFQEPLREAGLLDRDDLHILCREDAFGVPWADIAAQARACAVTTGANLLIGDTLAGLAGMKGDEENSSGAAMEAIRPVQEIAAAGVAVVVSRHDRRAGGEVGESGRGSTAFSGAVDMIFRLTRLGGEGRGNMRRLDYVGRIRGVPESRILELTPEDGYRLVGSDIDLKLQEARSLLLDHLPDTETDACTLPSLWAKADPQKDVSAGPLAGSGIGKNTVYKAADELLKAGKVARKEINAQKHVWWSVSGAPGATGHPPKGAKGAKGAGWVSGRPSPYRDGHRDTPDPDARPPATDRAMSELRV